MENAKKLKVMRGSEKHPELVKEWLESQGATNVENYGCNCEDCYYFLLDGLIHVETTTKWIWDYLGDEFVELEEPKPEHVFQPFDKVLVRDTPELSAFHKWEIAFFGRIDEENGKYIAAGGGGWDECIPYEGNEHLLGTTDSPKGGE